MRKREEHFVPIPSEDAERTLEGVFIAGTDDDVIGVVVAAPHPAYGGSMDSPVVNELAYAARGAGMASLRFNWRGVGGSTGAVSSDFDDAVSDYRAALQQMLETVPGAVIAAGYSFGAGAAQHAAVGEQRVRRLVLVAPPPAMLDLARLGEFSGKTLLLAAAEDAWAPADELQSIAADHPRVTFACIPCADHFFGNGLADIRRLTAAWLTAR